ncbi:UDP-N-acetylmuramoyl-tripeptide--D-alanyl-D-alanine ligase [Flavobacterium sp.]|uniref:UDP-N-acetylmuramoyl-tripeptide--D-alanyl-D- alanine ligase n=1 Tax=Flavobacterium sp. TaxID=239 RepID=UPI00352799DF
MEINELHQLFLQSSGITTDTRTIKENSIFFALKGENFDANEFAHEAIAKGASLAIIDNPKYKINGKTITVKNCLETLQKLAQFHRNYLNIKIIGLTGSNGKTTTKELFNVVLSQKYNTLATIGNLNNHIGVPLTLLRFTETTEIGIVEMGANHQKEIEFLCEIAQPDIGYITNFGKAHLEGFGGVAGIIKGKSELYNYLRENNKTALVNLDDTIQEEKTKHISRFTFSTQPNADIYINAACAEPMVKVSFNETIIQSNLIGLYNASNINAAIALGKYFNIDDYKIKKAIENYIPTNNRSQLIENNNNKIILDAYNANPSSMDAALLNFFQLKHESKIAILGDMFELGEESQAEHQKIIELCNTQPTITFYLIGSHFYSEKCASNFIHFFTSTESFISFYKTLNPKNSLILIKGSRGMKLEKILDN